MFTCISRQKKHNSWCRKCPHTFTWTQRAGIKSVHLWLGVVWSVRCWDKTWGSWFICTCLTGHIQIFLALHLPFQQNRSTFRLWPTLTQPRSSFKLKLSYAEGATKKIVILSLKVSGNARYQRKWRISNQMLMLGWKLIRIKQTLGMGWTKTLILTLTPA